METLKIRCPICNKEFPLDETTVNQIRDITKKEIGEEIKNKERKIQEQERKLAKKEKFLEKKESEVEKKADDIAEKKFNYFKSDYESKTRKKEQSLEKREKDLKAKFGELEKKKKEIEIKVAEEIEKDREKLNNEYEAKIKGLEQSYEKREEDLVKKEEEFEKEKEKTILKIEANSKKELEKRSKEIEKNVAEKNRLKLREKDLVIEGLVKDLENLQRKADQAPPTIKGDALEKELEERLKKMFREDEIKRVPKGKRGADIIHRIYDSGRECGVILWETKNASKWYNTWIEKIKDDMQRDNAQIGVILATTLKKGIDNFGRLDKRVWVTNLSCSVGLAQAIRGRLIEVSNIFATRKKLEGKLEPLYEYISGRDFIQSVEEIVHTFISMKDSLEKERKYMLEKWSEREEHILHILENVSKMYLRMKGIVSSLPEIKSLDLKALSNGSR